MSADDGEPTPDEAAGLVVISSPSAGRSTRARVLFQTLLASAQHTIHINSPYFLPDRERAARADQGGRARRDGDRSSRPAITPIT